MGSAGQAGDLVGTTRLPAGRQPGAPRGDRRRRGRAAALRARPGAAGRAGQVRRAWLMAALYALDRDLRDAGGPGSASCAASRRCRDPRVAKSVRGAAGTHQRRLRPVRAVARRARCEQRSARTEIELVRTGSPYAVAPGTLKNGSGDPSRSSARSIVPGWSTGCTTRRPRYARARVELAAGRRPGRSSRSPTPT